MHVDDLDTPVAVVDLDKLELNIREMASLTREAGVRLRPHVKTHKVPAIAHMQLREGAAGITVAKLGEAEVMASAGIEDIFVAYPIWGEAKWERLRMLNRRARMRVSVDSEVSAEGLSEAFSRHGERIDVLVKVDTGLGRIGVLPGEPALRLARKVEKLPGLNFKGIFTHEGHIIRDFGSVEEVGEAVRQVAEKMRETAELIRREGMEVEEVSVGSTPSARIMCGEEGITEQRPGTYAFYDAMNVGFGVVPEERVAFSIICTVVSTPAPDRAVIDGGTKVFSSARSPKVDGMGLIRGVEGARFAWANEEHGVLDLSSCPGALKVGDRVEVVPVHVCEAVNLWDELVAVRKGEVEAVWPVLARGKVR